VKTVKVSITTTNISGIGIRPSVPPRVTNTYHGTRGSLSTGSPAGWADNTARVYIVDWCNNQASARLNVQSGHYNLNWTALHQAENKRESNALCDRGTKNESREARRLGDTLFSMKGETWISQSTASFMTKVHLVERISALCRLETIKR
jgi:hypothetical protein